MEKAYRLIKAFNYKLRQDDISTYASSIAFFLFLSLIPLLILVCFLIPYTPLSESDLMKFCLNIIPKQMNAWSIGLISRIYDKPKGILSVTFLITIWSAGKGMLALMRALNQINEVMEKRGYLKLRLVASFYTVVVLMILVATFVLGVFGKNILAWVMKSFSEQKTISGIISWGSYVVMNLLAVMVFGGIYTYVPNPKLCFKKQIPGAVFVAATWSVFTFGFSLYIEYFSGLTAYGTLGTIVLFLFWMYFCSYIILMGAVINWFYDRN